MSIHSGRIALAIALLAGQAMTGAEAKPIAFANGWTVMTEYGAGTMAEVQVFYAPSFRYSVGGGHLALDSEVVDDEHDISYLRLNVLPKRWNFEKAQANVFVWGGIGTAHIGGSGEEQFAWNAGGQFDVETRRIYVSLRTDRHEADAFSHHIETLQFGIAPYEHEYDQLAVWFVVQGRDFDDGKLQAMLMFNF